MKNGDISNSVSMTFAFRCEDFLIRDKDTTIYDKIVKAMKGKYSRPYVQQVVAQVIEHIFRNTEYTVDVVAEEENYPKFKSLLEDLPFNRVILITKLVQITGRINIGDISYYVDDDEERLRLINSEYAVKLSKVYPIINSLKKR